MKFTPPDFFEDIKYLGNFDAVRQVYYMYQKNEDYMLVTLSRNKLNSFTVNFVKKKCIDYVIKNFAGKTICRKTVENEKPSIFGSAFERPFAILNTFYILTVLGKAEKVEKEGRALWFKIKNAKN